MKKRLIALVAVILLGAIGIAVWKMRAEKNSGFAQKEALSFGMVKASAYLTLIALNKGYFEKEGLDIKIKVYESGSLSVEGMFNDEVDVGLTGTTSLFESFTRKDFKIICATDTSYGKYQIICRKDKGILNPKDLRGKRIATQKRNPDGRGTQMEYFLINFLLYEYIMAKDVEIVFLPMEGLVPALISGDVDGFCAREPYISQAQEKLKDNAVIFSKQRLIPHETILIAKNSFIQAHPYAIERFIKGLVRAEEFALEKPDEAMAIVVGELGVDKSVIKSEWPHIRLNVYLSQQNIISLENFARWAIKHGFTQNKDVPNYLEYIYTGALEKIDPERVTIIK